MKSANTLFVAFAMIAAAMLGGCGMSGDDPVERTGIAIGVQVEPTEDVTLRYTIHQVACAGESITNPISDIVREVPLDQIGLPVVPPEGTPGEPGQGLGIARQFGDEFFVLPQGCYDIKVEAILADGSLSTCGPALAPGVRVNDGLTTERLLVLQCPGVPNGGLDGSTIFNQPPLLQDVEFRPSKFLFECEAAAQVCARATDLDGDPLRFEWSTCGTRSFYQPFTVVDRRIEPNTGGLAPSIVECVNVVPQLAGDYCMKLTIKDLTRTTDGLDVAIEDILAQVQPGAESHDDLEMPIHSMSDVGLLCKLPDGNLDHVPQVRDFERVPGCAFTQPAEDLDIPACE
ncbi:MAG: hypothetical protein HYY06_17290 [Deltaproteobacteria bacterium]|nr:hypothetical protein [Deltaproteobacteria bacterium]